MLEGTKPGVFLSTLSLRRATKREHLAAFVPHISIHALLAESDYFNIFSVVILAEFLSTLSLRRATILGNPCAGCPAISIHALLAESDHPGQPVRGLPSHFYPRSPCGERLDASAAAAGAPVFLSTLSLRRATQPIGWHHCRQYISIHALLAESDVVVIFIFLGANQFLSTLSLRRATDAARRTLYIFDISIHALLAESDKSTSTK